MDKLQRQFIGGITAMKDCYCHTCEKEYHHLGIARHRGMHRDKYEDCEITYSTGKRISHQYSTLRFRIRIKEISKRNGGLSEE